MKAVWAAIALVLCLAAEAALGRLVPRAAGWVDLMWLPVVWYGLRGTQRSAMIVGCVAGLMQDSWFQAGLYGQNGFVKTLLGWAAGGIGSRFDLNHATGRMIVGSLLGLADPLVAAGLRGLLGEPGLPLHGWSLLGRALATGLTVTLTFALIERTLDRGGRRRRR